MIANERNESALCLSGVEIGAVCDLTVSLVELRQRECKHLCVENVAPEIFHRLLTRMFMFKCGAVCLREGDADAAIFSLSTTRDGDR